MGCCSSNTKERLKKEKNNQPEYDRKNFTKLNEIKSNEDIKIISTNLVRHNKEDISKYYTIVKKLGSGSFGSVYKVLHNQSSQYRAMKIVKILNLKFQEDDKSFLREIEILSQTDHPNIIKIHEYFIDDVYFYLITELIEGGELYDQINKRKHYSEEDAAVIFKQMLTAINYLHKKGIVHRDLKPENILLENKADLHIKIIDFGTSNYYSSNAKLKLKVGTPYYIAPEVLKKEYNEKCDIWSLGIILFVLLSGKPPFDGKNEKETISKVLQGEYSFETNTWQNISTEAKQFVTKLLTYNYKLRISAEEALNDAWLSKNLEIGKLKKSNTALSNNLSKNTASELLGDIDVIKPLDNLRKFGAIHKFQQATIAFLVRHACNNDMTKDLREIFELLDTNGDGTLSYQEIKEGFNKYYLNEKIAEKELEQILKRLDQDNSDSIEYEEFIRCTIDLESLLSNENLKIAFDSFDIDGNGSLSSNEIKQALGVLDDNSENAVIRNIIRGIDLNGDGDISFKEFKELMENAFKDIR